VLVIPYYHNGVFLKIYRVFIPLTYPDGKDVENEKLHKYRLNIKNKFNAYTQTSIESPIKGEWYNKKKSGFDDDELFTIEIVVKNTSNNRRWFKNLKKELMKDLKQEDIFILCQNVEII